VLAIGTGLLVFALTAAFMRHALRPDFSIFEITGGAPPQPGEPLFLRVSARMHDARTALPVTVSRVSTADGRALPLTVRGENPALLETTAANAMRLEIAAPRPTALELMLDPATTPAAPGPPATAPVGAPLEVASARLGELTVELVPMGGDLVAGLRNRVFLRLRDGAQQPVVMTRLSISHRSLPNGGMDVVTDRDGLADFTLLADRPNLDVEVARSELDGGASTLVALRPLGRELTLSVPPRAPTGAPVTVEVETLRTRGLLSCELLRESRRGPVWVHALDRPITSGRLTLELPLPELAEGTRLDLQCALVPGVGLAWASRPIRLGAPSERLSDLVAQTLESSPRSPPRVLLKTRDTDRATFEDAHGKTRTLLVVALACVLASLLLFAVSHFIVQTRRTRASIRAALAEDPTLTPTERGDIAKTRGLFFLLIGLSLAIGWITAVAALLA
jgi:hypothetical protein